MKKIIWSVIMAAIVTVPFDVLTFVIATASIKRLAAMYIAADWRWWVVIALVVITTTVFTIVDGGAWWLFGNLMD